MAQKKKISGKLTDVVFGNTFFVQTTTGRTAYAARPVAVKVVQVCDPSLFVVYRAVTEQQEYDLVRITAFNLEARYPDYKREFRKKCTAEFSTTEIQKINEVFSWLKSML